MENREYINMLSISTVCLYLFVTVASFAVHDHMNVKSDLSTKAQFKKSEVSEVLILLFLII